MSIEELDGWATQAQTQGFELAHHSIQANCELMEHMKGRGSSCRSMTQDKISESSASEDSVLKM